MALVLLPAVDVAGGQAVGLTRGDTASGSSHGDPFETAVSFEAEGAEWIHLVDLDLAFGRGSNAELLANVVGRLDVDVELSGGIDDDASLAQALGTGCARVILATTALRDPTWCERVIAAHGDRIAVALDVRIAGDPGDAQKHTLAARGSTFEAGDLWSMLERLEAAGCSRYVVTDVDRDGMLSGPNVELLAAVDAVTNAALIASGGVSSLEDLSAFAAAAATSGLEGAIVGKALYAGRFTLPEALAAVRG